MRYASCRHAGRAVAVEIGTDGAVGLGGRAALDGPVLEAITAGTGPRRAEGAATIALDELTFGPVVPRPGKIFCVGLNYDAHVGETGRELPTYPVLFTKFAQSLTGPFDAIPLPPESAEVDYEAELAVVIGRPGRRIAHRDALDHVAGYTLANDVTMRDYQYRTHQWLQGKAWERSTPLGPWLVTPDEVGDVASLELRLELNGRTMQEGRLADLIFDVPTLITTISEFVTLDAGDVILTGTPAGVGYRREPKVLLTPGDTVVVEIDRIGRLQNQVVAEEV